MFWHSVKHLILCKAVRDSKVNGKLAAQIIAMRNAEAKNGMERLKKIYITKSNKFILIDCP